MKPIRILAVTALSGALAFGVAACGDDELVRQRLRRRQRPVRQHQDRRLVDRLPLRPGRRRAVQGRELGRRRSRSASPAPAAASRSSAPARPTSPTPRGRSRTRPRRRRRPVCKQGGVAYSEVQVANDGIAVVTSKDLDDRLHDDRPAQGAVEQGLEGLHLQGARPVVPRPEGRAVRPGHGLRHVRLLHRRDQRRGGRHAQGLLAVARTTTSRSRASRATRAGSATSASPTSRTTPTT